MTTFTTAIGPLLSDEHPRIRERRDAVEGETRRVQNRTLLQLVVVCAAGLCCALTLYSPLFDLEQLAVQGWTGHPETLSLASGLHSGEALVSADIDAARRGIAALPTVESVTVDRSWNGTITVNIVERSAAAAFAVDDGRPLLVDRSGRILGRGEAGPGVVLVRGVELSGETSSVVTWLDSAGASTAQVADEIPADMSAITRELQLNEQGYSLRLRNGTVVRLGAADDLPDKFTSLRTLLLAEQLHCARYIDLRAAMSPVIDRQESCV